jgi:hypothetical protein
MVRRLYPTVKLGYKGVRRRGAMELFTLGSELYSRIAPIAEAMAVLYPGVYFFIFAHLAF